MLARCANPSCRAEFVYLHEGKLFLLKSSGGRGEFSSRLNFSGQVEGLQYAWLCDQCATRYEVAIDSEGAVKVRGQRNFTGIVAALVASIGLPLLYASSVASQVSDFCSLCP